MNTTLAIPLSPGAPPRPRPLVWHQIGKDLRRHRLALLAWLILLVVGVPWLSLADSGRESQWVAFEVMDFLAMALTARLVFEDPPAGSSRAFWLTLPLAPRTLWAARLALLAGVVWLPLLAAQLAQLILLAVPAAQWPVALLQAALWEAGLILTAAVVASRVTGYLRMFGVMVMGMVLVVLLVVWHRWAVGLGGMEWLSRGLVAPLLNALIALPAFTAFALLARVYRARRHAFTPMAQVGGALALLLAWGLMYDALAMSQAVALRHPPRDAATRALFDLPIRLEPGSTQSGEALDDHLQLVGDFVIPEPPRGFALSPARIRSRLELPDGRVWSASDIHPGWTNDRGLIGSDALFGYAGVDSLTRGVTLTRPILDVPESQVGRPAADLRGVFTADVDMDGYRSELAPALPLRAGVTARWGPYGLRILRVDRGGPGHLRIVLSAVRTRPGRAAPAGAHPLAFALLLPGNDRPIRIGREVERPLSRLLTGLPIASLVTYRFELDADSAARFRLSGAPGELDGAALLISREVYVGTLTRHFRVEGFRAAAW